MHMGVIFDSYGGYFYAYGGNFLCIWGSFVCILGQGKGEGEGLFFKNERFVQAIWPLFQKRAVSSRRFVHFWKGGNEDLK